MKLIFIAAGLIIFSSFCNAQCSSFAKKNCKPKLAPFIHDGAYNTTILGKGESAELFKTFYNGQEYRISVCCEEKISPVHFQILDTQRNILYDNKEFEYSPIWDFKLNNSQQLIISMQIDSVKGETDKATNGCVAILIGLKN